MGVGVGKKSWAWEEVAHTHPQHDFLPTTHDPRPLVKLEKKNGRGENNICLKYIRLVQRYNGTRELSSYITYKRGKWRNSVSHFLGECVGFIMTTDSALVDYFLYSTSTLNHVIVLKL